MRPAFAKIVASGSGEVKNGEGCLYVFDEVRGFLWGWRDDAFLGLFAFLDEVKSFL